MLFVRSACGKAETGRHETRGFYEFAENCIGVFSAIHLQRGRFISGEIEICFSGSDGMALAGLNSPDFAQALGFRGDVEVEWQDKVVFDDVFDRSVTIRYQHATLGERTDYEDLCESALLDLAAIDAFLDRMIYAHLLASPTAPAG